MNANERRRHGIALTGWIVSGLILATTTQAGPPPTLEQRLERVTERLEAARVEQHIPGMAIAIVKDDQVVLARGFGLANLENEIPVTSETIFAIGSSSKAFTAAVIGMLVDEGHMTWDDPATKWLPYFTLGVESDEDDAAILLRDMLSHRTGYTRMSLLWAGGKVPREEILRTANNAEPWAPYRNEFLYNNVMFMAAGMCAGAAADSSWEALVRDRIFAPLGMIDATLTMEAVQADSRLALGYRWDTEREEWERDAMRNIDMIGPAGSINAHVEDMAQWLRFQLGRGVFESNRLLSEEAHTEMWTPQMTIAGPVSYGFGWMVRDFNGQPLVEHGGNIDGFAAAVALLPESNLGFVLLSNIGFSRLQSGSIGIVFEAMTGDWSVDEGEEIASGDDGENLEDYTGVYVANYAQFDDEKFTVSINDEGRLAIDIPSQMVFTLNTPDENGRRPFVEVTGIAAAFDRDDEGGVPIMRLYQSDLKFEVPREGYEYPVEIPLDELRKYQGTYRFEQMSADVTVLVKNNHLAVDVPGQMVFELHPPDDEDRWQFRNNDVMTIAVTFNEGEFGEIESLTMHQMGQQFEMPRLRGVAEGDVPTLEAVFELAKLDERQAAFEAGGLVRMTGTARFVNSGISADVTLVTDAADRVRNDIDAGRFGMIRTSLNGDRSWADISFDELDELEGRFLDTAKRDHPVAYLGDWRPQYDEILVTGLAVVEERDVIVLKMTRGDLPPVTCSLDAETGDILKVETATEIPGMEGMKLPVTTFMRDWRVVDGLRIPFTNIVETEQNGRLLMTIDEVEMQVEVPDDYFTLSRPESAVE